MQHRKSSPPLTPLLASKIKALWAHSSLNQAQIAARLGELNQGRVSITGQKFTEGSACRSAGDPQLYVR